MVEFVSYDGEWGIYCSGNLVVKINGKIYNLGKCLRSGGCAGVDDDGDEFTEIGPWSVIEWLIPKKLENYIPEIRKIANDNIPWGCCGGCI